MENTETSSPISITLNGLDYIHWAQAMTNFLKARRVWRIIIGEITEPVQKQGETTEKFIERQEDWDSKNGDIVTWCRNTSTTSINQQFGRFNTTKEVWDFLKSQYTAKDLAHQYQLLTTLHAKTQQPYQSIDSFQS